MTLDFSKPKKVENLAGFDGGPENGYQPQMSRFDATRWKAKLFNANKSNARIELRKTFSSTQVFIIVALDGWDLSSKNEKIKPDNQMQFKTKGLNVRMSMNGPLLLTFEQFEEIQKVVDEAKDHLSGR